MNLISGKKKLKHLQRTGRKSKAFFFTLALLATLCMTLYSQEHRVYRVKHMLVSDAEVFLRKNHPEVSITPFYSQNIILLKGPADRIDFADRDLGLNDLPITCYFLMDITVKDAENVVYKGTQLLPLNKESCFERSSLTPVKSADHIEMLSLGHFFSIYLSKQLKGLNVKFGYTRRTTGPDGKPVEEIKNTQLNIVNSDYVDFKIAHLEVKISFKSIYNEH